jgi:DNA recombination protein RmuC
MEAFLNAQEAADDETREAFLAQHAQQVRNHVSDLRRKDYQSQFEQSPELVIMFVPSEGIYHSALAQDSTLLEYGLKEKVLIATPTTLIGILQAINYGWGQDVIARSAQEIAEAGKELHKRILTFAEPLARVGRQLDSAAGSYNQAVGSYERMVVPQLRRIEQAGAGSAKEISELGPVDTASREIVIDTSLPGEQEAPGRLDAGDEPAEAPLGDPT